MIEITDVAKEKLMEVLEANPGKMLRVFIQGHG
jgi:Fe-S cluster assembly iron-binding protein IscA